MAQGLAEVNGIHCCTNANSSLTVRELDRDDLVSVENVNRVGAIVALTIFAVCILMFCWRLADKPRVEHWLGLTLTLAVIPLVYLMVTAPSFTRPPLYYVQISLMVLFLIVELLLDYVLKIPFREERWMVVAYVTLFFGATGGMLGVAATAGPVWAVSSVCLFLAMAVLAFVQHSKTGM